MESELWLTFLSKLSIWWNETKLLETELFSEPEPAARAEMWFVSNSAAKGKVFGSLEIKPADRPGM